jgi:membrane protease YdiL (CAAX protease family)
MTALALARPADSAKHSLATSVLLHLFPGAALVAAYLLLAPLGMRFGLPPLLTSCILALVIMAPLEIGHLLRLGRQMTGAWTIRGPVTFTKPMAFWRYALIVPAVIAVTILAYALAQPADLWFKHQVMGFLPAWFDYFDLGQFRRLAPGVIAATLIARFLADVVVVSAAEELYFRGYLLPRIPAPAWLAPIVSAVLFAIYHFWQPYNWPSIALFTLPMILAVWWTKDVRISIACHILLNLLGFVVFAVAVLH